jgi:excinuclease UvrABC nuclease subunit
MTAKTYPLEFEGYWCEPNVGGLPAKSGIYGVYACTYNAFQQTVSLARLLYIGEAADVRDRVGSHDQRQTWKRQLKSGESICVNAALISPEGDRQRAEAAMIFKHKPPYNTEYVDNFPFDTTTITTTGKNVLMQGFFTVNRVEKAAVGGYGRRW